MIYLITDVSICQRSFEVFFSEEITHIDSSRQKTLPKPLLYKDTDLDNSLVLSNRPSSLDLGIVSPLFKGVAQAFVANE